MSDFDYWDRETGEGLTDYELHQRYDEFLDEVYGNVTVAGLEYQTSRTLKEIDPVAYRVGFGDWTDSEMGETLTDEPPDPQR